MAEVTGSFGAESIELNNAATEATLRELVNAMTVMSVKLGTKAKSQAQIEKELKKFQDQIKKATDATKDLTEQEKKDLEQKKKKAELDRKATESDKKLLEVTNGVGKAFNNLGRVTSSVVMGMTNLVSTISNVGDSLSSAASSMNQIPVVGGILANVFGAAAGAADKMAKTYQTASTVGVNFEGSLRNMVRAASGAGLTLDQFAGIIAKNGEGLAVFGGNTEAGAKRLAQLGRELRQSPVNRELLALGFSAEQVNNGLAAYTGMMARTGAAQNMSNTQLVKGAANYLKQLDGLAKLTGKNREELQKEREARLKDAQFRAMMVGMSAEEQATMQALMDAVPEEHKEAFKDMLATGNMTSEAAIKFAAAMPGAAQATMQMGRDIQAGVKPSVEAAGQLYKSYINEAKAVEQSGFYHTQARYNAQEMGKEMVGVSEAANRQADGFKNALAATQNTIDANDGQVASIGEFQQAIAEAGNMMMEVLVESGLLAHLEYAFATLVDVTNKYVVPAFQFLAENFNTIITIAGVLAGSFLALKGVIAIHQGVITYNTMLENLRSAAKLKEISVTSLLTLKLKALMLPFIKIGLVVGGLVLVGKLLWDQFKKFGGDVQVIGDAVSFTGSLIKTGLLTAFKAILSLINKIPGFRGTFTDAIEGINDDLEDESKKRENIQNRMSRRMEENRQRLADQENEMHDEKADQHEDEMRMSARQRLEARRAEQAEAARRKATEEATKAEEARAEATMPTNVGTGDPLADMKLYTQRQIASVGRAAARSGGVPDIPSGGLGSLAAKYESGGKGSEAIGWDSTGGTSYGKYQIASKTGTMDKFLNFLKTNNPEAYERLMAAGPADAGKDGKFAQEWKALAKEGGLGTSEHDFIKATHFDVGMKGLKDENLSKMIEQSKALQEVMWSTSVQHGGGGASGIFNKVFKEGMSEEDLIKSIYAERGTRFGSSTSQVQASVQRRFQEEQQLALGMVGQPGTVTPSTQTAQSAVDPAIQNAMRAQNTQAPASAPATTSSATQQSPAEQLEHLNMQVAELIRLTREGNKIGEKQVGAITANSMDTFSIMGA
jgi:hypothetical protein